MASPKIKRPPRGRSSELARYLEQCGVPPAPPEDRRRGLEDAATVTRRALAAELRRRKLIPPLRIKPGATEEKAAKAKAKHAKRADDLARLEGWVPEPARSEALAAAAEGHDQVAGGGSPLLGSLLARALLARNAAAAANIRLAIEYALGVDPRGGGAVSRLDPADLVQECMIAVVHTAEVYDRTRGATGHSSFANCAGWWLRHYAERALRELGHDFAPPGAALSSRTRVVRALDALESATGDRPGLAELARKAKKPERICRQVVEWAAGGFVFGTADRVVRSAGDGDASRWLDLQADPGPDPADEAGRAEAEAVGAAVDALPPAQRDVIRAVHGIGCDPISRTEIARRTGRTRAQVEALADAGEAELRRNLTAYAADFS